MALSLYRMDQNTRKSNTERGRWQIKGATLERIVNRSCLISNGIFSITARRNTLDYVFCFSFLCLMMFTFIGTFISMARLAQYRRKIEISLFWMSSWIAVIRYLGLQFYRPRLLYFMKLVFDREYFGEEAFLNSVERFRQLCRVMIPLLVIHYVNVVFLPFIKTCLLGNFMDASAYTISHFLTCGSSGENGGNSTSRFCWEPADRTHCMVKNSVLSFIFLVMILPYATNLILFAFVIIHVKINEDTIKKKIKKMFEKTDGVLANGNKRIRFEAGCPAITSTIATNTTKASKRVQDLKDVIEHYGKLFRLVDGVLPLLNYLSSYYMIIFYFLTLINLTLMLEETKLIFNLGYVLPLVISTLVFYSGISAFCYGGQIILNMTTISYCSAISYALGYYSRHLI